MGMYVKSLFLSTFANDHSQTVDQFQNCSLLLNGHHIVKIALQHALWGALHEMES